MPYNDRMTRISDTLREMFEDPMITPMNLDRGALPDTGQLVYLNGYAHHDNELAACYVSGVSYEINAFERQIKSNKRQVIMTYNRPNETGYRSQFDRNGDTKFFVHRTHNQNGAQSVHMALAFSEKIVNPHPETPYVFVMAETVEGFVLQAGRRIREGVDFAIQEQWFTYLVNAGMEEGLIYRIVCQGMRVHIVDRDSDAWLGIVSRGLNDQLITIH